MREELLARIREVVSPVLADRGVELVELTCHRQGRGQVVRLLVDRVGGVTIQQCAEVNSHVGQALDAADLFEGGYVVEVSSPGLDRPLRSPRDFERALGEELRLVVDAGEGRLDEVEGMLLAVRPEAIVLKTPGGNLTVPSGHIRTAKKSVRW